MQGSVCAIDKNRVTWDQWDLQKKKCEKEHFFKGNDLGGRGLCSHPKNTSNVEQEGGHKRCGLPWCPKKESVNAGVTNYFAIRAAEKEKERVSKQELQERAQKKRIAQNNPHSQVIDLTKYVSQESIQYAN
jgi:hypothetical protein